jgi:hypothetical protein
MCCLKIILQLLPSASTMVEANTLLLHYIITSCGILAAALLWVGYPEYLWDQLTSPAMSIPGPLGNMMVDTNKVTMTGYRNRLKESKAISVMKYCQIKWIHFNFPINKAMPSFVCKPHSTAFTSLSFCFLTSFQGSEIQCCRDDAVSSPQFFCVCRQTVHPQIHTRPYFEKDNMMNSNSNYQCQRFIQLH